MYSEVILWERQTPDIAVLSSLVSSYISSSGLEIYSDCSLLYGEYMGESDINDVIIQYICSLYDSDVFNFTESTFYILTFCLGNNCKRIIAKINYI